MKNKLLVVFSAAVGFLMVSGPVFAHHGGSIYDMGHLVTIKGTVTEFEWINPHSQLHLDVKDDKGNVENWTIEVNSPNTLHRAGWTRETIKPGDQVGVIGYRAKDGSKAMRLRKLVLSTGQEISPVGDN